jgi:hypothetical protein
MFRVYDAMWQAYVWAGSHPDDPRWDQLFQYVIADSREAFKKDITDRWAKGWVLEPGTGRKTNPHVFTRNPRSVDVYDCHVNGSVWVNVTSRQAVDPTDPAPRRAGYLVRMDTESGAWFVAAVGPDKGRLVSECGAG